MTTKTLISIIVIAVIVLGALWAVGFKGEAVDRSNFGFTNFTVQNRNLVAQGVGLTQVQIWAVPTGTGITEANHVMLGNASSMIAPPGTEGLWWTLPIPLQPMSVTEIYAKGFDETGKEYRRSLDVSGATDIYNTLWMTAPSLEKSLKVGESMTLEGLTLTFNKVTEDSRCPAGVQCIQAGRVTTSVTLTTATASSTQDLSSDSEGTSFENYFVKIVNITPEAKQQGTQDFSKYEVTFNIEKDIKL